MAGSSTRFDRSQAIPLRVLDSASPLPLHAQLEHALREQLQQGQWKAGDLFPSERELMQRAGVSRATVRQALSALMHAGLLQRIHGRGTFVAAPRIEQPLHAAYSFAEQIRQLGKSLIDRLIQSQVLPADPILAQSLGLPAGEPVIHIQRLRLLEGVPFTIDNFFVAQRLCPDLLKRSIDGSLYQLLAEGYDLPVLRCVDTLEPIVADRAAALYLQVAPGAPLMHVERIGYTRGDLPLHMAHNYIRGDMCRFRIRLPFEPAAIELRPLETTGSSNDRPAR
ncbi:MAG TPA: GntR family transcriptional regulator [Roseiflexaceae bacterium]|nr:GntR family transcriptional regulator [Roseiflexaceae bacterium]HMP41878.1 GntR family transcriptional regulator [Roseiflexaceae bacterium]